MLWCYLTPIFGAVIADQYLGRLSTIMYSCMVYMVGLTLLALSSLFVTSVYPIAVGGLALAMVFVGVGTGGIKANVGSLLAEQYTGTKETITTTDDGEKIIVDPKVTIQRHVAPLFSNLHDPLSLTGMQNFHDVLPIPQHWFHVWPRNDKCRAKIWL